MNDDKTPARHWLERARGSLRIVAALGAALLTVGWRLLFRGARRIFLGLSKAWRGLDLRRRRILAGALAAVAVAATAWSWRDVPHHWREASHGKRPLLAAKSWHYNLSSIDVDRLANQPADLLVIDYAREDGNTPLSREDLTRIKAGPDGKPRVAISYISIGEAESYRFYWNSAWEKEPPGWLSDENCAWPRNFKIRFWHDGWKDIVYRGPKSYIKKIIDAGFDGVYLDRIDVYGEFETERPGAREDMIEFVREMAETARKIKPGFIFIAQNAESLLIDRAYRGIIDGLGKEDLLYGVHGTEKRNPRNEIASNKRLLRKLLWDWKPVVAVEYLATPALIESARKELSALGIVPTFAHRNLDGLDPTQARPPGGDKYGTAEWIAENCKHKPHW